MTTVESFAYSRLAAYNGLMLQNTVRSESEQRFVLDPTTREEAIQRYFKLASDTTTNAVLRGQILMDFRRAGDSPAKLEAQFQTAVSTLNKFIRLAELISNEDLENLQWSGKWTVDHHLITRRNYDKIRADPGFINQHLTVARINRWERKYCESRRKPTKEPIEECLQNQVSLNRVHCCDCRDGIKLLPDMSIALLLCSPMYADSPGGVSSHVWPEWLCGIMDHALPKMSADGNVIINVNSDVRDGEWNDYVERTIVMMRARGWIECHKLYWLKPDIGHFGSNERPKNVMEYLLWFSKSRHPFVNLKACGHTSKRIGFVENGTGVGRFRGTGTHRGEGRTKVTNVLSVGVSKNPKLEIDHPPPQFPPELARQIILTYAKPGGIILDPFSGSGTTCLVAQSLDYDFIGFEIVPRYAELCNYRLQNDEKYARPR